jgi:hypothetical protein
MSSIYRSCYAKHWDLACLTDRNFNDDWTRSFVDLKRKLGAAGEGIELFLEDVQGFGLDDKFEELKALAATVSLDDLQQGVGPAGQRLGAWLDERSLTSGTREHKNPLTATRLYNHLKIPVRKAFSSSLEWISTIDQTGISVLGVNLHRISRDV